MRVDMDEIEKALAALPPHNGEWVAWHVHPGGRYEASVVRDGDETPLCKMWHADNIEGAHAIATLLNIAPALLSELRALREAKNGGQIAKLMMENATLQSRLSSAERIPPDVMDKLLRWGRAELDEQESAPCRESQKKAQRRKGTHAEARHALVAWLRSTLSPAPAEGKEEKR